MQLFINTRGSLLKRQGERFQIRNADRSHEFAATKVHSIVIATGVRLTSNVIQLASDHNVDIVFLDSHGHPNSRIWQTKMGSTAAIRRRQLEASLDGTGQSIARQWIIQKTQNQIDFLEELKKRRQNTDWGDAIDQLAGVREKLTAMNANDRTTSNEIDVHDPSVSDTPPTPAQTMLGLEGTAGRIYFSAISQLLPSDYQFNGRSRRPAIDPFNAMLNYAYGVLYSQVERALILAGLDPFIGFFHTDHYNKPSLVYDLIEPFRIIAERTTTLFFTGKRAKQEFFRDVPGGVELSPEGRAPLIESLNKRLDKSVRYPIQKPKGPRKHRNIKLRDTIRHEAHALANQLLGKTDIPKVIETETLFAE